MNIFNYLLIFLGLRKKGHSVTTKNKLKNIISRKVIQKKEYNEPKTPRNIVREIYKRTYNKELSPPNSPEITIGSREIKLNISIHNNKRKQKFILNVISWMYTLFIFLILCIKPIISIYNIVKTSNKIPLLSVLFFQLIEPFQYILSIIYFSTTHFEDFFLSNRNLDPKCFPNINTLTYIIISVLTIIIVFNFLYNSYNFTNNYILNIFIELFSWIYGRLVIYINLTCFSLIFCKHSKIIEQYVNKVQQANISNQNILTINIITQDILIIRNELEDSIDKFKNIFSSFTLLGTIGLALFFESKGKIPWNQLIIYLIVQTIFIIIVLRVSSYQKKLTDHIRQPLFVKKFLKRYTLLDINEKFEDNRNMVLFNLQEENSSMLDWIILDRLLNEQWAEFSVLGINISNGELIKRGIAIVTIGIAILAYFNQ